MVHYGYLDDDERARLEDMVQVFVAEKHWEGCAGFEVTDDVKVTVAGQACLLLLGLPHLLYSNVFSILLYPSAVRLPAQPRSIGCGPVVDASPMPIAGEARFRGPVLLVWDKVREGAFHPQRGHNVVYHEFAHKLDMLDGTIDGTPPLADSSQYQQWIDVCTAEYEALRERSGRGERALLDPYGATNPGEFFAVATEYFFDRPRRMAHVTPDLYGVLGDFYNQDPAERERRYQRSRPV